MKFRIFRATWALWVNGFTTGLMYFCISSMSTLIGAELGFSDAQLSVLFSLPTFAFVVTGWLPGAVVDRLGTRVAAPLTFALIWVPALLKLTTGSYALFLAFTLLQSVGILIASPTTSKRVKALDPPHMARVLGLVNTGMAVGTWVTHTFALPLARRLSGGWRGTTLVFLGATLLLAVASNALFFALKPPHREERSGGRAPGEKAPGESLFAGTRRDTLILIGVAALYFGTLATSFSLNNWLPKLLTYGGFTAEASALSASMFSMGSLLCAVGIPFLLPGLLDRAALPIPAAALSVLLLFALLAAPSAGVVYVISVLLGMIIGCLQLMVQYQIVANCSSRGAGKYSSFVFFVGNIGATVAILGVGVIPESMFVGKICFIAAFSLASVVGGLLLLSQKRPAA